MSQPLSLENQITNPVPEKLILDTSSLIKRFRMQLWVLRDSDTDEEYLVNEVLQALSYERTAQIELMYGCLDVIRSTLGPAYEESFAEIAEAITNFGDGLFSELKRANAYQKGYLFYQFMNLLGNDIVLVRLVPPVIK